MSAPLPFRQQLLAAIPRLRRYARALVFDTHAADDLVQTTLERALAHWHQFDQRRDLLAWLMTILHNAHMDELRRQARFQPASSHGDGELLDRHIPALGADPGLRLDLIRALHQLPPEQREPLLLVTLEQFSYAECADALRIPIGTVMSRVSRARAALRAYFAGPDGSAPESHDAPAGSLPLRRVV